MFILDKTDEHSKARRGRLITPHGVIETPVFMNVATCGAIKGGVSAYDLRDVRCQVMLSNTYHLHIRPGDGLVHELGGLQRFTGWDGPTLTDSGGFQVFSLAKLRKIINSLRSSYSSNNNTTIIFFKHLSFNKCKGLITKNTYLILIFYVYFFI